MIRKTLAECINLFNANIIHQRTAIRGMEQLGEWGMAENYWRKLGEIEQAEACKFIKDAIEKGDCYRSAVKHLNEWVDETVEKGIMSKENAIKAVYPEMQRVYLSIYS